MMTRLIHTTSTNFFSFFIYLCRWTVPGGPPVGDPPPASSSTSARPRTARPPDPRRSSPPRSHPPSLGRAGLHGLEPKEQRVGGGRDGPFIQIFSWLSGLKACFMIASGLFLPCLQY